MSEVWRYLNIDSLANSGSFGLEYYMLGDFDKAKPLLMKGIEFCDIIQKGNFALAQEAIDQSYLDAWEDIQVLIVGKGPDELGIIAKEAESIKIELMKMIQTDSSYSERDIRKMQKFFNDTSAPYLARASSILRGLERRRRL